MLAEELMKSEQEWHVAKQLPARKFDMLKTGMSPTIIKSPIDSPNPAKRHSKNMVSSMTTKGPGGLKKYKGGQKSSG